jgi:hypothetical protein
MYAGGYSLKVGSRVWPSTRVMILFEVRLERRGPGAVLRLVAERSASVEVEVVVVGSHLVLTLLHAPEHEGNATKKERTANATDDTTDDLLVGVAQAAVAAVAAGLHFGRVGVRRLPSGNGNGAHAGGCNVRCHAIAERCADNGGEWLEGCRYEVAGPYDGCCPEC